MNGKVLWQQSHGKENYLLHRVIVTYLCVTLLFPPQVMGRAVNERKEDLSTKTKVSALSLGEVIKKSEREVLLQMFQLRSWELAFLARGIYLGEYSSIVKPYEHCPSPFKDTPSNPEETGNNILLSAQRALQLYLERHAHELGDTSFEPTVRASRFEPITAESGAVCKPFSGDPLPENSPLGIASRASAQVQEPFFVLLSGKKEGAVTAMEARRWFGWLLQLRGLRAQLTKDRTERDPYARGLRAPEFFVDAYVAKRLTDAFEEPFSQIFAQQRGEAIRNELPKFGACEGNEITVSSRPVACLIDPTPDKSAAIEEKIMAGLTSPPKLTPGAVINTERLIAIKALEVDLAAVNALLPPDQRVELPSECRSEDLKDFSRFFDRLSTSRDRQFTHEAFKQAVTLTGNDYLARRRTLPLPPRENSLYGDAHRLIQEWIEDVFAVASPTENKGNILLKKKQRLLNLLQTYSFESFLRNPLGPQQEVAGFTPLLKQKLDIWVNFGAEIDTKDRQVVSSPEYRKFLVSEIELAVRFAFVDALEEFLESLAKEVVVDARHLKEVWQQRFRLRWQTLLSTRYHSEILKVADDISRALAGHLKNIPVIDPQKQADAALTAYVRLVEPRGRDAAIADGASHDLKAQIENRTSVWSFLPWMGNENEFWKSSGQWGAKKFDATTPWSLQVDGELGRPYTHVLDRLDPIRPSDFMHVRRGLVALTDSYVDSLTQSQTEGTEAQRREISKLAVETLKAAMESDETSDLNRIRHERLKPARALEHWLRSAQAKVAFQRASQQLGRRIYERYLSGILQQDQHSPNAIATALDLIEKHETKLGHPQLEEVITASKPWEARLADAKVTAQFDSARAKLLAVQQQVSKAGGFPEKSEDWNRLCLRKDSPCLKWLNEAEQFLKSPSAKPIFFWRSLSYGEAKLRAYLVRRDQGDVEPNFLANLKKDIFEAWYGVPLTGSLQEDQDKREIARTEARIREWIERAHELQTCFPNRPEISSGVLWQELKTKLSVERELWEPWRDRQVRRLQFFKKTISEAQNQLTGPMASDWNHLFNREINLLQGFPLIEIQWEDQLARALSIVLLPRFTTFQTEILNRLEVALKPEEEPGTLGSSLSVAWLKNDQKLRQLLSKFLPEAGPAKELVSAMEKISRGSSASSEVWESFFEDQFADAPLSDRGRVITPNQILSDLNVIASQAQAYLKVDPLYAIAFLRQSRDYCEVGLKFPSFHDDYRMTLAAQMTPLTSWASPLVSPFAPVIEIRNARLREVTLSLARLKRIWDAKPSVKSLSSEQKDQLFSEWWSKFLRRAKDPFANQGMPSVSEVCQSIANESKPVLDVLEKGGGELPKASLEESYWRIAQLVSDVFLSQESQFHEMLDNNLTPHAIAIPPARAFPTEIKEKQPSGGQAISDAKITAAIGALVLAHKIDRVNLSNIRSESAVPHAMDLSLPENDTDDAKVRWINGLSLKERKQWYDVIKVHFASVLTGKGTDAFHVFSPATQGFFDFYSWKSALESYLTLWRSLRAEIFEETDAPPAYLGSLLQSIFSHFTRYTSYRIEKGGLVVSESAHRPRDSDLQRQFSHLPLDEKMAIIESISNRVREQISLNVSQPFHIEFIEVAATRAPMAQQLISPEQQGWEYYALFLSPSPNSAGGAPMDSWKSFCQSRQKLGQSCEREKIAPFAISWKEEGFLGEKGSSSERFTQWLTLFAHTPTANARFKSLGRDSRDGHLWSIYSSLDEAVRSPIFLQMKDLFDVYDNNARALPQSKTWSYFMARLNWKLRHGTEKQPANSQTSKVRASLAQLIRRMNLDVRDFSKWQTPFLTPEGGKPEYVNLVVESLKNFNVGVGARRFLKTPVTAPYSVNVLTGSPGYNFRPWIDDEIGPPTVPFHEWWQKRESFDHYAPWTVFADDEKERPLYKIVSGMSTQQYGENDLARGELARHDRVQRILSKKGGWSAHTFGRLPELSEERKKALRLRLEAAGLDGDMSRALPILAAHEQLVDFIKTMDELNLRYSPEKFRLMQGRGNDLLIEYHPVLRKPFSGNRFLVEMGPHLYDDMSQALYQYSRQLGWSGPVPDISISDLGALGSGSPSTADLRREAIAKANYWAKYLTYRHLYKGRTHEEIREINAMMAVIRRYYREEAEKRTIQSALRTVAQNVSGRLSELCQGEDVKGILTDRDLRQKEPRLKELNLAFFDDVVDVTGIALSSLSPEKAEASKRTLDRIAQLAKKQSTYRQTMDSVNGALTWAVGAGLLLVALGESQPAFARAAMKSRVGQAIAFVTSSLMGSAFVAVGMDGVYSDFWGRPDEMDALIKMVNTISPLSQQSLVSDEKAERIEAAAQLLRADQKSAWRFAFHLWGMSAGWQLLSPATKYLKGGVGYLLALKDPFRPVESRFAAHSAALGLPQQDSAFTQISQMRKSDAETLFQEVFTKKLSGKPGKEHSIHLSDDAAALLEKDVLLQMQKETAPLGLSIDTLEPLDNLAKSSGVLGRFIREERANVLPRLKFLRNLQSKLRGGKKLSVDELVLLLGPEADPLVRHTPLLWSLLAIPAPYPSRDLQSLRNAYKLAQAHLDVFSLHQPEVLFSLAYLGHKGSNESLKLWQAFSPRYAGKIELRLPEDVSNFFKTLFEEAVTVADTYVSTLTVAGRAEKEAARLRAIREVFEETLAGNSVQPFTEQTVGAHSGEVERLRKAYPRRLDQFSNMFLVDRGIAISKATENRLAAINAMALWEDWDERAMPALRRYAEKMSKNLGEVITPEDVIEWAVNPRHPRHSLTLSKSERSQSAVEGEESFFDPEQHLTGVDYADPALSPMTKIFNRLRKIWNLGPWIPDRKLIDALARRDYRRMARTLTVFESREPEPKALAFEEPGSNETPIVNKENSRPPERPSNPTAPAKPGELPATIKSMAQPGPENLNLLRLVQPAKRWPKELGPVKDLLNELLISGVSSRDLALGLGELRRLDEVTPAIERAYRVAIAHIQSIEWANAAARGAENSAERAAQVFKALMDSYLSDLGKMTAARMSRAEAMGVLRLKWETWPTIKEIEHAASLCSAPPAVRAEAENVLRKLAADSKDRMPIKTLDDLALVLGMSPDLMIVPDIADIALNRYVDFAPPGKRPYIMEQARGMVGRLFGSQPPSITVDDAFRAFALPVEIVPVDAIAHVSRLRNELALRGHRRAVERLDLLGRALTTPQEFPMHAPATPTSVEFVASPVYWHFDNLFQRYVKGLKISKSTVDKAIELGLDRYRAVLWNGYARRGGPGVSHEAMEELSRLMHSVLLVRSAEARGMLGEAAHTEQLLDMLMRRYVKAKVRFSLIPNEARIYLKARFGRAPQTSDDLEDLVKWLQSGKLGRDLLVKDREAIQILERAYRSSMIGLESFTVKSKSHMPFEALLEIKDRRLIYFFLDGPSVKYSEMGDGMSHWAGRVWSEVFGDEISSNGLSVYREHRKWMAQELQIRLNQWTKENDPQELKHLEEALHRLQE